VKTFWRPPIGLPPQTPGLDPPLFRPQFGVPKVVRPRADVPLAPLLTPLRVHPTGYVTVALAKP